MNPADRLLPLPALARAINRPVAEVRTWIEAERLTWRACVTRVTRTKNTGQWRGPRLRFAEPERAYLLSEARKLAKGRAA